MLSEISSAARWWSTSLAEAVDAPAKASFVRALLEQLQARFAGHWYVENPIKGQAYRSIVYDPEYAVVDDAILAAAEHAGIPDIRTVLAKCVSSGVRMWIDPDEVTVENVKGKAQRKVIYQGRSTSPRETTAPRFSGRGLYTAEDHAATELRKAERMKANVHRAHFVPSAGYPGQSQPLMHTPQAQAFVPQNFTQYHQFEAAQHQPLQGRQRRADQLAY